MRHWAIFAVLLATSAVARAGDKVVVGPVPAWVKPTAFTATAITAKPDEAPVRLLFSDQQLHLERGRQTVYSDVAFRIQTPQGLEAGNISFPWKPDTDELTVHKLLIRRGDKTIDVLASGQTFTVVRRETNLESATLDGVLTANIQPEGLQVGDILQFTTSMTTSDPVVQGHVEALAGAWNGVPIDRAHLRVEWPSTVPIRLRQTAALPATKPVQSGIMTTLELSLDNLQPVLAPKGAPARYQIGRLIELTDFKSWADLGSLLAPLYHKAAVLPAQGPLAEEVARIKAISPDPKVRAEAALALVQDRVRYVALAMGTGGLVPADATTTWSRRYGDCKGKTVLLLAVLRALGIDGDPVAVSSALGDGMDQRLPRVGAFDHVLVRATIGGRSYWMDGTRKGDTSLDRLKVPGFGWGLPLIPSGAALVRMMPAPLETPTQSVSIRIDASAGLTAPAPIKVETIFRGDAAAAANTGLANLVGDARDRALRDYWKGQYDFVEVTATTATFDPKSGEERMTMEGKARMDWSSGWYETDGTGLGYKADFSRDPGPDRDAPFAVAYPYFNTSVETIVLPPGFPDTKAGAKNDTDRTVAGVEYHRRVRLAGGTFTVETSERSIASEFPARDAVTAQAALRELAGDTVYIRRPDGYRPTDADMAVAMQAMPKDAAAFLDRGNALMDREQFDAALKDFEAALALEPKNAIGLADRGLARVWKRDFTAGARDLDAALAVDPRNAVAYRGRGLLADVQNRPADAIAAYTKALDLEPGNGFALGRRAGAYRADGKDTAALADAASAIAASPAWIDMYLLRANIFRKLGQPDQVASEAAAMIAANPDNGYAHVAAARIYDSASRKADAMREYDRAIAIKPEAYIYINRVSSRPKADRAGRLADIESALKLEPKSEDALSLKAQMKVEDSDFAGAIAIYTAALVDHPGAVTLLVERGIARSRAGNGAGAETDFAAARKGATEPADLNNLCWTKATAGVALASALADCDAALAKAPDVPAFLDSKAFVLLRLGRIDEAIALYDRVLSGAPNMGASLYGRAIAWSRKGDTAKASVDQAAARKASPGVDEQFAGYGLRL